MFLGLNTLRLDGGQQTYRCLQSIKLSYLTSLYIHREPIGVSVLVILFIFSFILKNVHKGINIIFYS